MIKFLSSDTDKELRLSEVWVKHNGITFSGVAMCHPDDEWSEFFGCGLAETRAMIQAAKYELRKRREEYKICLNFVKAIECYKDFDKFSISALKMYRQLNRKKKEVERAEARVILLKETIPTQIENREKYKTLIEKIKNSKNKGKEK